jgi:MoaA/NifB/PqqE/SkfB family radical SAM enzyme
MGNVYSSLKFLRYRDHLDALKERRVVAPVHIRIKPINRCNHDCWYCCYRVNGLVLGENMDEADAIPEQKMFEIVDDVIDMGVQAITFSGGGEPLIYRPLPRVVERLAKSGVKVATLTNGVNLTNNMADAFAEYGTWVRISTDGWDDASYAKARNIKDGEFTRVIRNIREFTARDTDCVLGISFVISRDNHQHIYDVCSMMHDAGAHHIKLYGVVTGNDAKTNNSYHSEIDTEVRAQIERAKTLTGNGFSIVDQFHRMEERFDKSYDRCPFLQFLTVIGADCQVYSCQDKAYTKSGVLGSIKDRSFKEFWFSEDNHRRLNEINPSVDCKHHCVAHQKNLVINEFLAVDDGHASFV